MEVFTQEPLLSDGTHVLIVLGRPQGPAPGKQHPRRAGEERAWDRV